MQYILLVLISLFSLKNCNSEKQPVNEPQLVHVENVSWQPTTVNLPAKEKEKGFRIEDALPSGYVKDGTADYTVYIQQAIFNHDNLIFPAFPLKINDAGLKVGSNKTLKFLKGSELRLAPSDKGKYAIIDIRNAQNVTLIDPVIIGDRAKHLGSSGEWGMGVNIVSSKNVTVYNARITDCWGDGIYIAGHPERGPSKDVKIVNAYLKSNRRNGISIISVDGLELISPYSGYNDGIDPKCGIDIEPNKASDHIKNIRIVDARTEYNPGTGISVGINKLYGSADQKVNIDIQNHVDYGSLNGFLISCSTSYSKNGEKVSGSIRITDPVWKYNPKASLSVYKLREPALFLQVQNAKVTDVAGKSIPKADFNKSVLASTGSKNKIELN